MERALSLTVSAILCKEMDPDTTSTDAIGAAPESNTAKGDGTVLINVPNGNG